MAIPPDTVAENTGTATGFAAGWVPFLCGHYSLSFSVGVVANARCEAGGRVVLWVLCELIPVSADTEY